MQALAKVAATPELLENLPPAMVRMIALLPDLTLLFLVQRRLALS
jgi:hypothetical protein